MNKVLTIVVPTYNAENYLRTNFGILLYKRNYGRYRGIGGE